METSQDVKKEMGQHFVFGFHGYEASSDIETLIRDYHLGSIILFKRNVQSINQVRDLTHRLQQIAKDAGHEHPLLIGIDQENGLVSAFVPPGGQAGTQFPGAMALAATGDPTAAQAVSNAAAQELKLAGINWAYSPVADVNSDARNPVIGVRSFSDDPTIAGAFVQSVARGIASAGVAPCAKHFPGHGDTHVDSHLALPTVNKTLTEMDATELVPFRGVIGSNSSSIASIMTAHIALPNLTLDDHPVLANEASVPASLSRRITHDLLRTKLEFRGVITTDCLEMEAIAGTVGVAPGAVQALRAGADIAMICHRFDRQCAAVEATWAAVQEGTLNKEELKASGQRIEEMKVKFVGRWEDVLGVDGAQLDEDQVTRLKKTNAGLSARTYGKSIALVSASTPSPLPLPEAGTPIVLYVPRSESINAAVDEEDADTATKPSTKPIRNTLGPTYAGLAEALERRVSKDRLRLVVYTPDEIDTTGLAPGGTAIFASQNAHTKAWQVDALKRLVEAHSTSTLRIVLISTCAPYDIPTLQTVVQGAGSTYAYACLATFEFTWPAFVSVVQVLFGEAQATGKIPVRLATV